MFTELARIADNSSDESLDEAIADVQMEALVEMMPEEVMVEEMMAEESDAEAKDLEMTDATLKKCPVMDMTAEELADFVALSSLVPEHDVVEDPIMEGFTLEEMALSKIDLMDLLKYNMDEVGDSIKEFPAFMTFLIENGLYREVDQAPVANDEAPVAQVTSEAKNSTQYKTSVLISRLKDVIKTGKKRNSNVALDEEEIEHHRKMLKTIEKAGHVLFRILM
jgi:hypothetical protein